MRDFLKLESAGGLLLVLAAVLALVVANSPLSWFHAALIDLPVHVSVGEFVIAKPLLLWINDGLMAVFFLLIGLELKRELFEGEIADFRQAMLPAFGALGGMALPALIYVWINIDDPVAMQGWAIPAATDIAFAMAVLGLLGKRVPVSIRVLLVSIAIFDDLGAIVIIALFYTDQLLASAMVVAAVCIGVLLSLNRMRVMERAPYLFVGLIMWIALLKSGVHATLAGVILAAFIPIRSSATEPSPLHDLEHDLHTLVAFGILPLFAFANAGVTFPHFGFEQFLHPVPLGVAAGLFVGKQLGVFAFCWIGVKSGMAKLPKGVTWSMIYGVAVLCGIGFTMSFFIASLAFEHTSDNLLFDERIGILLGSVVSAAVGYLILNRVLR